MPLLITRLLAGAGAFASFVAVAAAAAAADPTKFDGI